MIVKCPKCNADKNIGSYSRFYVYRCDSCRHRFRGIHADISKVKNFFFCILNPLGTDQWSWYHSTCCPYCGCMIDMNDNDAGKGFVAPENCRFCHRELPVWGAIQRSDSDLDGKAQVNYYRALNRQEENVRLINGEVDINAPVVWNPDGTRAKVFPPGTFNNYPPPAAPPPAAPPLAAPPLAAPPLAAPPPKVTPPQPPPVSLQEILARVTLDLQTMWTNKYVAGEITLHELVEHESNGWK